MSVYRVGVVLDGKDNMGSYHTTDVPQPDRADVVSVLSYIDQLRRPISELAEQVVIGGDENTVPNFHWSYAPQVDAFCRALQDLGFIIDFDWTDWQDEAHRLTTEDGALDEANMETLMKLLTIHVRTERYSEGHLATALEQGWIAAILERLAQLHGGETS